VSEVETQKPGLGPIIGIAAVAAPLAVAALVVFLMYRSLSEPERPAAAVVEPEVVNTPSWADEDPQQRRAPTMPTVGRRNTGVVAIKSTGKTKVSTVGPAEEPPPFVVPDDSPSYGPRVYSPENETPQSAPPPPREQVRRPEPGVTYREAVSSDPDPLLPIRSGGGGSTTSRNSRVSRR
jgi:hypothetical protein